MPRRYRSANLSLQMIGVAAALCVRMSRARWLITSPSSRSGNEGFRFTRCSAVLTGSAPVADDGVTHRSSPRSGCPTRRRTFSTAEQLEHPVGYGQALADGGAGGYVRSNGLHSSLITE